MKTDQLRTVLTVLRDDGQWAVECEGERFGHATDKEIVTASAHRRAREILDGGRGCQVVVHADPVAFHAR